MSANIGGGLTPGIIWITGYSASGKTTVARIVDRKLKLKGLSTVFLDGDDLRNILADRWGYTRSERTELAKVYFHLCSHLANQGLTVIISAIAMYDEVRHWISANVPRSLEVYLRVPEDERRRRDAATKGIYNKLGDVSSLYDEPSQPDLLLDNWEGTSPEDAADAIVEHYLTGAARIPDGGRKDHWRSFYTTEKGVFEPSPFARSVLEQLRLGARVLEVGCGNGRDAAAFAAAGCQVVALDVSEAAIDLCRRQHDGKGTFVCAALPDLSHRYAGQIDVVYSRFCFHAMTLDEEVATIAAAFAVLRPGGVLHVECRSINDPLAREGEVISPTERIHGHYRRFIIKEELAQRVEAAGFQVETLIEADGLAVFRTENPVVIRLRATKP